MPLLPVALSTEAAFWPRDWTPLLLLALGSQVIGQGLVIHAMGHLPPIVVGLGLLTQPIVGAAIGWLFYAERLTGPMRSARRRSHRRCCSCGDSRARRRERSFTAAGATPILRR